MSSTPVFGKRNAQPTNAAAAVSVTPDHAAFFAAARNDLAEDASDRLVVVPRSFKAAFLAGLVVGCALAGFDVTGSVGAGRVEIVEKLIGVHVDTTGFLPVLILIGLVNGARMVAFTILGVHMLLAACGQTSRLAYAIGGAAASLGVVALFHALGHPIGHGWTIDALAGAGAAFLYRVIAGARPA